MCSSCWCTQPGVTGSVASDLDIDSVGDNVDFTLTTNPAGICYDCVTWSGGGEPATQEGGSTFITHWDTPGVYTVTAHCCGANFSKEITIFKVDLDISGLSEEQEEDPGKYIGVNNDDDNTNSIADYAETGTVANEDDLVIIGLSITPVLSSGSAMLEAWYEGDVCPIKLWLYPTKGTELPLYQAMEGHSLVAWNLSQETLPEKLYVEGYRAGDVNLVFSCNNVAFSDSAVFHVCECGGDPNKVCCNGECREKCKNGPLTGHCDASHNEEYKCPYCVGPGAGVGCQDFTTRIYTGNINHSCSGGCDGDCERKPDVHCYTEYRCVEKDVLNDWACVIFGSGELGCVGPDMYVFCIRCQKNPDDEGIKYYVTNWACK